MLRLEGSFFSALDRSGRTTLFKGLVRCDKHLVIPHHFGHGYAVSLMASMGGMHPVLWIAPRAMVEPRASEMRRLAPNSKIRAVTGNRKARDEAWQLLTDAWFTSPYSFLSDNLPLRYDLTVVYERTGARSADEHIRRWISEKLRDGWVANAIVLDHLACNTY